MSTVFEINGKIENLASSTEEISTSADLILQTADSVKQKLATLAEANA